MKTIIERVTAVLAEHHEFDEPSSMDVGGWFVCLGCGMELETDRKLVKAEFTAHQAERLAHAGLLPTETEWSITDDNDDRRVASEEACRSALKSILRRGLSDGDRIESRYVASWKDAS